MSLPKLDDKGLLTSVSLPHSHEEDATCELTCGEAMAQEDEGDLQLTACEEVGPRSTKWQGTLILANKHAGEHEGATTPVKRRDDRSVGDSVFSLMSNAVPHGTARLGLIPDPHTF